MLKQLEREPLGIKQLQGMLTTPVKFFDYDQLHGKSLQDVMSEGKAIIYMRIKNEIGRQTSAVGHWIALLKQVDERGDFIEHFDSYGLSLDKELALTHSDKYLSYLLQNERVFEGKKRLQKVRENVNTCGRHVVQRCNMPLSYSEYVHFLSTIECPADTAVTLMTLNASLKKV